MKRRRRGTTHLELIMASVLLGATLVGITTYRQRTIISNQTAQRASFAQSRILNLRRELTTWPIEEITVANVEQVPADESGSLPQARWLAQVKDIDTPIAGKQIMLALQWQEGAHVATSPGLTFWVKRP